MKKSGLIHRLRSKFPIAQCAAVSSHDGERDDDQSHRDCERDSQPVATGSGRTVVMSVVADANANTAPITDAPVMSL